MILAYDYSFLALEFQPSSQIPSYKKNLLDHCTYPNHISKLQIQKVEMCKQDSKTH